MNMSNYKVSILTCGLLILSSSIIARHGSNVLLGGFMGAGMGAMLGGNEGVVPGLVTGLAVGTTAEILEHENRHHRPHYHEVVFTHEVYPSRFALEQEIEDLNARLHKMSRTNRYLAQQLEEKDYEIHHLHKRLQQLEYELKLANSHQKPDSTEFIFSAKAVKS
jgi:hypothetical protein